ncbi:MAG TPA: DUF4350 domain-containing protein [Candidatus Dormibacteraeota bacterium]|nr:DUF4350 domain-containing protein [Candidatus Dormibacteraeota bacterium]
MSGWLRVARRELRAGLVTPATYAVAVAFLALAGITLFLVTDGSREASLRFWFPNLGFVLLVTVPIVTSRLVADEWRSRHLDVLLSRPVSAGGVVVGKWLAATALVLGLLVPTLAYVGFLAAWGRPDWPPIVASYLGAALTAGFFCGVGTMSSALTPTAVVAGLGSFAVLVALQLAGGVDALRPLSFQPHLESFARGAPELGDLVYLVSGTVIALVVAGSGQRLRRRLLERGRALLAPALALAAAVAVNLVPIPAQARWDLTASGRYTLSRASGEVLQRLTMPARVSAFEPNGSSDAGDARILLDQFARATPRLGYRVLDLSRSRGEALRLGIRDDGQVAVEVGGRREVISPLTELTLTSALQRLARGRPQQVCALAGHGERELDDTAPGGYDAARTLLENNAVDTARLDLTVADRVPPQCTVLAMIDPHAAPLPREVQLIGDWMAHSGRMLIAREPNGPDLDPLTARWGLRLLPGLLFDPARGLAGDPTSVLVNSFPTESPVAREVTGGLFVTAGAVTTAASEDTGLSVARVAQSTDASYLHLDPGSTAYQPDRDRRGPVVIAGAADRSMVQPAGESRVPSGGPSIARTRLLVVADAEWASNEFLGELDNRRLLTNGINWLAGEEDIVAVGGENPDLRRLALTPARRTLMGAVSIGGLPGLALLSGGLVWLRRRGR